MFDALATLSRYTGKYLKPHKKTVALTFGLSTVSIGLGMIQPLFAQLLIDTVLPTKNARLLLILLGVVVGLFLLSFGLKIVNSFLYTRYSAKVLFSMREDLFSHLQRVPFSFFSKARLGDIYSRMGTDIADIQLFLTDTVPSVLFTFLTCLITIIILIWLNWKMALMSFAFFPVGLWGISRLKPRILTLTRSMAEKNADIAHFLIESLEGNSLIRAYGAAPACCRRLNSLHSQMIGFLMRHQVLNATSGSIPLFFTIINTLVVFGYGGFLVMEGSMTIGGLVAFSVYQGRVFGPLQGLIDSFLVLQKSKVALDRVEEIMRVDTGPVAEGTQRISDEKLKGDIRFKDVFFSYTPEEPLFENLSFQIPPTTITALVGPSGAGKSTLCNLAMGLIDPQGGTITLDDIDIKTLDPEWLRKQFALVSQDTFLFHDTIFENIRFSKPEADEDAIITAAKMACIHDFIQTLPDGYNTIVGDRGVRLSGGQRQRVSIARAILRNPKILLLDEATAFLDHSAETQLKDTLRMLMLDKTLLIVSHRDSTISGASNTITLNKPSDDLFLETHG
jgi:ATP-binding cassette, subfamily B, bacterial